MSCPVCGSILGPQLEDVERHGQWHRQVGELAEAFEVHKRMYHSQ